MKIRNTDKNKDEVSLDDQMAPMIDVVFQLLMFFMLTLKIIEPEGSLAINMPRGRPEKSKSDRPPMKQTVTLEANADGSLKSLSFGANSFSFRPSRDDAAIDQYINDNPKEGANREQAARRVGEDAAFREMNKEVERWVDGQWKNFRPSGDEIAKKRTERRKRNEKNLNDKAMKKLLFQEHITIKIKFPFHLQSRYGMLASSHCRGRIIPGQSKPKDLVRRIEYEEPVPPSGK